MPVPVVCLSFPCTISLGKVWGKPELLRRKRCALWDQWGRGRAGRYG